MTVPGAPLGSLRNKRYFDIRHSILSDLSLILTTGGFVHKRKKLPFSREILSSYFFPLRVERDHFENYSDPFECKAAVKTKQACFLKDDRRAYVSEN